MNVRYTEQHQGCIPYYTKKSKVTFSPSPPPDFLYIDT